MRTSQLGVSTAGWRRSEDRGRVPGARRRRRGTIASLAASLVLVGCGTSAGALSPGATAVPDEAAQSPASTAAPAPSATPSGLPAGAVDSRIDIGGGELLHIRCTAGTGPMVILDADLNGDMSEFELVMPKLPLDLRACAYDRAGEGSSSRPLKSGRTSADMANELHALLAAAGLSGPYVLVGNHFGGLFDLRFAAMYPGDIGGLVLLDPFLPTAFIRFHADCAGITGPDPNNESVDMCDLMTEAAHASLTPPDVPLVVVTAADNPGWPADEFDVWLRSHRDLAASVSNGRQVTVTSELVIPREQPDATVRAIDDVVNAARLR